MFVGLNFENDSQRLNLVKSLEAPSAAMMLQPDGSIHFHEHVKWSEVASKVNMVISASESMCDSFAAKIKPTLTTISQHQQDLSQALMEALLQAVHKSVPEAAHAISSIFLAHLLPPQKEFDWAKCQTALQRLADLNLQLLIKFDVKGVLGQKHGKSFCDQLGQLSKVFQLCQLVSEWLKPGFEFQTVYYFQGGFVLILLVLFFSCCFSLSAIV